MIDTVVKYLQENNVRCKKVEDEIQRLAEIPDSSDSNKPADGETIYEDGKNHGAFREAIKIKAIIQSEPEETNEYTEWLENMVILLAEYYQESHDTLYRKLVNRESNLYLEIPTIQDTDIINAVRDISKLIPKGTITVDKLQEFVKKLESR